MAMPVRTPEQHDQAHEAANAVRLAHLRLLAQVTTGELTLTQVLATSKSDLVVAKTRNGALLRAVPGYGGRRADRVLAELKIAGGRRVGALNAQQHVALLSAVTTTTCRIPS